MADVQAWALACGIGEDAEVMTKVECFELLRVLELLAEVRPPRREDRRMETFFWLLAAHALADFPLQGEFLATAKNHKTELGRTWWPMALPAHALIHGAFVARVTGSMRLGLFETVAHLLIDRAKCEGKLNIYQDQAMHVACKAAYALALRSREEGKH